MTHLCHLFTSLLPHYHLPYQPGWEQLWAKRESYSGHSVQGLCNSFTFFFLLLFWHLCCIAITFTPALSSFQLIVDLLWWVQGPTPPLYLLWLLLCEFEWNQVILSFCEVLKLQAVYYLNDSDLWSGSRQVKIHIKSHPAYEGSQGRCQYAVVMASVTSTLTGFLLFSHFIPCGENCAGQMSIQQFRVERSKIRSEQKQWHLVAQRY